MELNNEMLSNKVKKGEVNVHSTPFPSITTPNSNLWSQFKIPVHLSDRPLSTKSNGVIL